MNMTTRSLFRAAALQGLAARPHPIGPRPDAKAIAFEAAALGDAMLAARANDGPQELRDLLASSALQGLAARPGAIGSGGVAKMRIDTARFAFELADAMPLEPEGA